MWSVFQCTYYQVGDIVSLVDDDEKVYYAQIRGFLQDQYYEKSAVITWLLPTSASSKEGFDPSTYILGTIKKWKIRCNFPEIWKMWFCHNRVIWARAGTDRELLPTSLLPAGTHYHSILGMSTVRKCAFEQKRKKYCQSICLSFAHVWMGSVPNCRYIHVI